ncbi:MAG TPA: phospholipase D-like domain-containing protein [Bryobacteraceae bacterium]
MRLLVNPGDGIAPLVEAINSAKNRVEIVIFRFDQREIERSLASAVSRGVAVHALIAHTNRNGQEHLRRLEMRLLAAGVTVARTADDLERYHNKMMIVDRRELYVMAFNLTLQDIERSRSFGVITRNRRLVAEAVRLFDADTKRVPFEPGFDRFVVSPANARKELTNFIRGTKKELVIYDPKISDPAIIRLLEDRARAGVEIRIIGRVTRKISGVSVRRLPMRLHTRTMVRDGRLAFVGSQSLREMELDNRREVGVICRERDVVSRLEQTFQEDWDSAEQADQRAKLEEAQPAAKVAKMVAKAVTRDLTPVAPLVDGAVREVIGQTSDVDLNPQEIEEAVKDAVKAAVKEAVRDVVEEAVEQNGAKH